MYVNDYDKKGNLLVKDVYSSITIDENTGQYKGTLTDKFINKYNENGCNKEASQYNGNGSLLVKNLFTEFDENCNPIKGEVHSNSTSFTGESLNHSNKTRFKYDSRGNRIEEGRTNYNGENYIKYISRRYDSNNNLVELKYYYNGGKLSSTIKYSYNKNGHLIEENTASIFENKTTQMKWEYELDNQGNWTKGIHYTGINPDKIVQRTIEYY